MIGDEPQMCEWHMAAVERAGLSGTSLGSKGQGTRYRCPKDSEMELHNPFDSPSPKSEASRRTSVLQADWSYQKAD